MLKFAENLKASLNTNAAERIAYETEKNAHSAASKLIKYATLDHKTFETKLSDSFFDTLARSKALNSFDFINNAVRESNRFNVYAIEKAFKALHAIVRNRVDALDKYDRACVLTVLLNKNKSEFAFSRDHAKAMLSRAFMFENVKRSDLATTFNVAESTASTQVSSSFRALEALNVLTFDESARDRCIVRDVNLDHAIVQLVASAYDINLSDADAASDADTASDADAAS